MTVNYLLFTNIHLYMKHMKHSPGKEPLFSGNISYVLDLIFGILWLVNNKNMRSNQDVFAVTGKLNTVVDESKSNK